MGAERFRIIRDPLWSAIRLDPLAARIVDTPAFQRLRYVRQLGLAHLVYPGATHTRFDHALGMYHLSVTANRLLRDRGGVPEEAWEGEELIRYAALLHDIGHYAFSHALEELEPGVLPGDHEEMSVRFFESSEIREALAPLGIDAPSTILDLIRGRSEVPLRGLVSGSLDLDKMEYLRRDARFCGVPYGEVDVDRLLRGLIMVRDPESGRFEVGVEAKSVSALESLLFAKYQMFRNVYWHHGVRAATVLYKRIVGEALEAGLLIPGDLVGPTDEELLHRIDRRAREGGGGEGPRRVRRWVKRLRSRRLPKRALELSAADLEGHQVAAWVAEEGPEKRRLEDRLAAELGLKPRELVVDFPLKKTMFQLDILVRLSNGGVRHLDSAGLPGLIDLPRLAGELYRTARVLRVFTFERRTLPAERVLTSLSPGPGS